MPPTARTHPARTFLHRFLDWWKEAPIYKSVWFLPFVAMLYLIAVVKNFIVDMLDSETKNHIVEEIKDDNN